MTDHFARLGQPRAPWLDPEALKQAFHIETLRAHPDANPSETGDFAELNEAYQVLRDPKRRLQHLLALQGNPLPKNVEIPREIEDLFPAVAAIMQQADGALHKASTASNALSLSLVRPEFLRAGRAVEEMRSRLRGLEQAALDELRALATDEASELQRLYLRFSYLGRWLDELDEKQHRLAS